MFNLNTKKIEISFEKDPNYRRFYATGVWGAVGPTQSIGFDLYEDVYQYSDKVIMTFQEGSDSPLTETYPEETDITRIKRVQHAGVVIPLDVLPSIISWLTEKLEEANKKTT